MQKTAANEVLIQYQKDPSITSDPRIQLMYDKLESYNQINKTNKQQQKKLKRKISKSLEEEKYKKSQVPNIRDIMIKVRRDNIVQEFINKLKLNITFKNLNAQDQIEYFSIGKTSQEQDFRKKIKDGKIYKICQNETFQNVTIVVKLLTILGIFYINSLTIAFDDLHSLDVVLKVLIVFSILFFNAQLIGMGIRILNGKIPFWKNYLYWVEKQQLGWQIFIHLGLILQLLEFPFVNAVMLFFLTKHISNLKNKFQRIQNSFVLSINFERYWQLMKIIIFNFCIAHILSIVLNLMGSIHVQGNRNWFAQKDIQNDQDWFVKYIWGYYWGTNIMLTVGFGDISAENHVQALILIFIQTFACMIMAYNVSEISKILQNISQFDQQKKIKFKVFNQMSQKYDFQQNFKSNVLNHIDKSIQKKHELAYIEQSLIQQLPQKIKLQVKRQVNKNVFNETYFFKNLTKKTQNLLAEKVNKIFAHPEEIILKNQQNWKILILRQGNVAITFKKGSSFNNGTIIEHFSAEQITKPELLSLKFIRKYNIKGDLKSLDFSILNTLEIQHFQHILKEHDSHMFQFYCSQRDRTQFHQFDLQIRKCSICVNSKHDKTECPRMHFIPLKQHIIYKNRFALRGEKVLRNQIYIQRQENKYQVLKKFKQYGKNQNVLTNQTKTYVQLMPSLQLFIQNTVDNLDFTRKIDKCLQKLDEGLKIMKGVMQSQQLVVDLAYNYKRYFPKHNPDNLLYYFTQSKGGRMSIQKRNYLSIL